MIHIQFVDPPRRWTANRGECPGCGNELIEPPETVCPSCGADLPYDEHVIDSQARTHTISTPEGGTCTLPVRFILAGEPGITADSQMMRDAVAADAATWEAAQQRALCKKRREHLRRIGAEGGKTCFQCFSSGSCFARFHFLLLQKLPFCQKY